MHVHNSAPMWHTSSSVIGKHPREGLPQEASDRSSALQFEANYARTTIGNRAFGPSTAARDLVEVSKKPSALEMVAKDTTGKVFSRSQVDAMSYQDSWLTRAQELAKQPKETESIKRNLDRVDLRKSKREDGAIMEHMAFDSTYSNAHVLRDTESALLPGSLLPTIDPRRALTRPRNLPYGSSDVGQPRHIISTPFGPRRVLPNRSFLTSQLAHDF